DLSPDSCSPRLHALSLLDALPIYGANKWKTEIGDGAFIGSNASLVAPVTIGKGATTGAGSTIVSDVPDNTLAVGRARQSLIEGRSEEHTSELQSRENLVCRLLLDK